MKHLTSIVSLLLLLGSNQPGQAAQKPEKELRKLRLELVYIFEADVTEFIFVIGNSGFRSVAALKKFVAGLPRGSTLEWSPGCMRFGNEPLLSSEDEMREFKLFCEAKEIKFILIPSG